jgi:hypothetical protein
VIVWFGLLINELLDFASLRLRVRFAMSHCLYDDDNDRGVGIGLVSGPARS